MAQSSLWGGVYLAYTSMSQAITERNQGRNYPGTETESTENATYYLNPSG